METLFSLNSKSKNESTSSANRQVLIILSNNVLLPFPVCFGCNEKELKAPTNIQTNEQTIEPTNNTALYLPFCGACFIMVLFFHNCFFFYPDSLAYRNKTCFKTLHMGGYLLHSSCTASGRVRILLRSFLQPCFFSSLGYFPWDFL